MNEDLYVYQTSFVRRTIDLKYELGKVMHQMHSRAYDQRSTVFIYILFSDLTTD